MRHINKDHLSMVGYGGSVAFTVGALALPEPYSFWALRLLVLWIAASASYCLALADRRPMSNSLITALITCVILAGLAMLFHGQPIRGDEGEVYDETEISTTFDSRAGSGVRTFLTLFIGSFLGIAAADRMKKTETRNDA